MTKRFISVLLALCIILLTACSNLQSNHNDEENLQAATTARPQFVEHDITPSELEGVYFPNLQRFSNSEVYFTGLTEDFTPVAMKMTDNYKWDIIENSGAEKLFKESQADARIYYVISPSREWWATWVETDGTPHLFKVAENGVYSEITIEFYQSITGKKSQFFIDAMQINDDGIISIATTANYKTTWIILDTNTLESHVISPSENAVGILDNKFIYGVDKKYNLTQYSLYDEKAQAMGAVPITKKPTNGILNFSKSEGNSIVYFASSGIYKYEIETNIEQVVTEKPSYVFSRADYAGGSLIALNSETYLLACKLSGGIKIVRYEFDKDYIETPSEMTSLTIWALNHSQMLKAVINEYSVQNPDVSISLQIGNDDNYSLTTDDIIKELNTRLVAGTPPDVIILDGLPVEHYINSGLLLDITDVVDKDNYYSNIINCYSKSGINYALPALFQMPVLLSNNRTGAALQSTLEEVFTLYSQEGNGYFENYYDMFEKLYMASSGSIFPDGTSVDEVALRAFLLNTKQIVDVNHLTSEIKGEFGDVGNQQSMLSQSGAFGFLTTKYPTALDVCQGMTMAFTCIGKFGNKCSVTSLELGTFAPVMISAIPADAGNVNDAKKFVACMLTSKSALQNSYGQGISVMKGADLELFDQDAPPDQYNPADYPWDELFSSLKTPAIMNSTLKEKVLESALRLYEGDITVDEAANQILQSTQLFFKELQS